jgi:hypothetical protein
MDVIPRPVAAQIAKLFNSYYSRTEFTNFFNMSGTEVESPGGNKVDEVTNWLLLIGRNEPDKALAILGQVLEDFFEIEHYGHGHDVDSHVLRQTMERYGLRYVKGGNVVSSKTAGATKSLESLLANKNFPAVLEEFERATKNVDAEPREAASAAANILEAICKEYIVLHPRLTMPAKQDLSKVFDVVRKDLGFDPSALQDDDLKAILSGLIAIVSGIAALRTHASSAHAQSTSQKSYRLAPRHARLAIHSAHAVVAFILETWTERESGVKP